MSFLKKPFKKIRDHIPGSTHDATGTETPKTEPEVPSKEEGFATPSAGDETPPIAAAASPSSRFPFSLGSDSARASREIPRDGNKDRKSLDKTRRSMDKVRKSMDKATRGEQRKIHSLARLESERYMATAPDGLVKLYRPMSMNQSKDWQHAERRPFRDLNFAELEGQVITFRARMHTLRRMSAKLVFIVFRQQTITIQGVLQSAKPAQIPEGQVEDASSTPESGEQEPGTGITERMVRSIEHYSPETIVIVTAKVRKALQKVKNATIHDQELDILEVHRVGKLTEHVPFTVYDAENINRDREDPEDDDVGDADPATAAASRSPTMPMSPELPPAGIVTDPASPVVDSPSTLTPKVGSPRISVELNNLSMDKLGSRSSLDGRLRRSLPQRVRLNNRIVDLRTAPAQAVFRIQAGICNMFRNYLDTQGFLEIHTPKLQGGASESGSTVFEVNYFGRPAFLAQSPQLGKQMSIAADFERVYEIGPVFLAEDSNTPRHLTEYVGLDLEMALEEHYHEALHIIDGMFKNLWEGIYSRYQTEIDIISQYYPHVKVQWLEETPIIAFKDGVQMLLDSGWVEEDGSLPTPLEDLSTRAEIRLGALVKEKYHTDYYILDKFPASVRPFYAMPDPLDDRFTNSFDIFMRGQEILTGGQRIHDAVFLEQRMKKKGVKPESMLEYMEGFRWGAPPHAGCGIGLERLTYLFLSLGNIRLASLFPRDPKSLPAVQPTLHLRHEEASTTNPPWEQPEFDPSSEIAATLQPLQKLIANYGDAANTSWLDERYHVWRHTHTGAAQGYVVHSNYAIVVGDPLCEKWQYPHVISAFLHFLKTEKKELHPIWMIAGPIVEEYLGEKFVWRTLSVIAEERVDPRNNPAQKDNDLARKVRHAEKENVHNNSLPFDEPVPAEFKAKVDARVKDWQKNRKGTQVHLTEIQPWLDMEHRRYFYASSLAEGKDKSEEVIHAICVLHQLSPKNGYQVKFSLEFPNAPSGTIESLILYALRSIASADTEAKSITFGTGAQSTLIGGRNLGKTKVKALKKAYEAINKNLKLTNKSEFREKMGAYNDPVYVCYPRGGLGAGGIRAIMGFLEAEG